MKKLILKRIEELRERHGGFSKHTMRWKNYFVNEVHISEVEFKKLNDVELLEVFEALVRRHNIQM